MQAARGRCAFIACVMLAFVGILSGCAVGGKSFAIDSNSRVPFFGFELQERKPKSSAPSYRSIAKTTRDAPHVKVALQTIPATPNGASNRRDKHHTAAPLLRVLDNLPEPAIDFPPSAKNSPVQSIPLPRTDKPQSPADRRPTRVAVDFQ